MTHNVFGRWIPIWLASSPITLSLIYCILATLISVISLHTLFFSLTQDILQYILCLFNALFPDLLMA